MARILLVEDQPDVQLLPEHVLTASGYGVDAAGTMAAARALLASKERGMKAPVLTGYALQHDAVDLTRHDYLLKPVRPSELRLAPRRILGAI